MRFITRAILLALLLAALLPAATIYSVSIDINPVDPAGFGGMYFTLTAQPTDTTTYAITNYTLTGATSDSPRTSFLFSNAVTSDNDTFSYNPGATSANISFLLTINRLATTASSFVMALDIPSDPLGNGQSITLNFPAGGPMQAPAVVDVSRFTTTSVTEVIPEPATFVLAGCGVLFIGLSRIHRRRQQTREPQVRR